MIAQSPPSPNDDITGPLAAPPMAGGLGARGGVRASRAGHLLRRIALFATTFVCIIPMQFNVGGRGLGIALVALGLLALLYGGHALRSGRLPRPEVQIIALLLILQTAFLIGALRVNLDDIAIVVQATYGLVMFCGFMSLARLYARLYGDSFIEAGWRHLFLIGLLHALLQLAVLGIPELADAMYTVIYVTENAQTHISQGYRSPGLFSLGAAILGAFNALILAVGCLAFLRPAVRPSATTILWFALAAALEIAAIAVSGRTGFMVLFVFILVLSARGVLRPRQALVGTNLFKVGAVLTVLTVAVFAMVDLEGIEANLQWSFEFIFSLIEGRGLATESTSALQDMFFLPDSVWGFLFGDGNFGRSPQLPYVWSDVGYVLMIFGGGVVGLTLAMGFFALILYQALQMRRQEPVASFFVQFLVIAIVVLNFKDFYFLQNSGVTQLVLFCHALLLTASKRHVSHVPAR